MRHPQLLLFLCILFNQGLLSQPYFHNQYDYPGFSLETGGIGVLSSGQIAVGGQMTNEQSGEKDGVIMLLSNTGNLLWAKQFDNAKQMDRVVGLEATSDGKMLVVMNKFYISQGVSGVFLLDALGQMEWSKQFSSPGDFLNQAIRLKTGFLLLGSGEILQKGLAIKIAADGQELWRVQLQQSGALMNLADAWEDPLGFIYIVGAYNDQDGLLAKLTPDGKLEWARRIGTPEQDFLRCIVPLPDDHLLLGGGTTGADLHQNAWLTLTDLSGTVKWSRSYGKSGEDLTLRDLIAQGPSPVFSISGVGSAPNVGMGLARINDSGDLLWIKNYDPAGQFAQLPYLSATPNNQIIAASSLQSGAGLGVSVIRTDAAGDAPPCCFPSDNLKVSDLSPDNTVFVPTLSAGPAMVSGNWKATAFTPDRKDLCQPVFTSFYPSDSLICPGACVDLTIVNPEPGVKYSWKFPPGTTATPGNASRFCFNTDSTQLIISLIANGCAYQFTSDTIYSQQRQNQYPNAFTPNGDNTNDVFLPLIYCPVADYYFSVFTRWGELVFETLDAKQGWDGTVNGFDAPTDVYTWTLEFRSQDVGAALIHKKGSVTLLR